MSSWRLWLHGLAAAAIGAAATAGSAALAVPDSFNFSHQGLINFAKLLGIPAAYGTFTYLKQSPVPTVTSTVTATVTKTVSTTPDAK
jgi:hypothetical protein